jgi:hypothetical protein
MQREREHFGHGRAYDAIRAKLGEEFRQRYPLLELPDEWLDLLQRLEAHGGVQRGAAKAAHACPTATPTARQQQIDQVFREVVKEYGNAASTEFLLATTSERMQIDPREIKDAISVVNRDAGSVHGRADCDGAQVTPEGI